MHRKNQRGFLIALCLCMLSVSGIVGVYQYQKERSADQEQASPQKTALEETEDPTETANSEGTVAQADTEEKQEEAKIETEEDIYDIGQAELAQAEETQAEEPAEPAEEETEDDGETEPAGSEQAEGQLFSFSAGSTMLWPVDGDVVLGYSMDKSIYFSTLNQYKYHPALVISSDVGAEVRCAARGRVSQIRVDEETGTTMSMDLGNGYEAVYGQLKETAVQEGDTVEAGTLIGYVSEPTKYYTLEGSNLYFQLLKNGDPVDPMEFLE